VPATCAVCTASTGWHCRRRHRAQIGEVLQRVDPAARQAYRFNLDDVGVPSAVGCLKGNPQLHTIRRIGRTGDIGVALVSTAMALPVSRRCRPHKWSTTIGSRRVGLISAMNASVLVWFVFRQLRRCPVRRDSPAAHCRAEPPGVAVVPGSMFVVPVMYMLPSCPPQSRRHIGSDDRIRRKDAAAKIGGVSDAASSGKIRVDQGGEELRLPGGRVRLLLESRWDSRERSRRLDWSKSSCRSHKHPSGAVLPQCCRSPLR